MLVELARLRAADGRALDALVRGPRAELGLVHLHSKGGNFHSGPARALMSSLDSDLVHLSLNMRCHSLGYSRDDVAYEPRSRGGEYLAVDGGFWEDLETGHLDVAAAVAHLRERGCTHVVLCGHSSGGYYAADYAARHADTDGRILLSPVLSHRRSVEAWFPEADDLARARERAEDLVAQGRGHHLITTPSWFYAISARSFLQRLAEPAEATRHLLLEHPQPTLLLWGTGESRAAQWQRLADGLPADLTHTHVIEGADHNYLGHAEELGRAVGSFLSAHHPAA